MTISSEQTDQTKRGSWVPFQCPSCFSLFRAQRDRLSQVGECPSCQTRLRITEAKISSEKPKVEVSQLSQASTSTRKSGEKTAEVVSPQEESQIAWSDEEKRKRHHGLRGKETLDWEEDDEESQKLPWKSIAGGITGLAVLCVGAAFILKMYSKPQQESSQVPLETEEDIAALQASLDLTKNEKKEEIDESAAKVTEIFETFDLAKVREATANFLTAETVEERSRYVRNATKLLAPMQEFYRKHGYVKQGFRELEERQISYRDNFISTSVQLEDFTTRLIALEKIGDTYYVDWESWVGYCSMSVEEIIAQKPTEPVEVRALIRQQNYYNYYFRDDNKWKSFRLAFTSSDQALWAYVERGSEVLASLEKSPSHPIMLKIAYLEGERSKDQVKILEHVTNGWVPDLKIESDE